MTIHHFNPDKRVTETADLGAWLNDDDVDIDGVTSNAPILNQGDKVIWTQMYGKGGPGYHVISTNPDLELLRIYGAGFNQSWKVDLTFLFDKGASPTKSWTVTAGSLNVKISQDDIFDDELYDRIVRGFRIEAQLVEGVKPSTIKRMELYWESWDIEAEPTLASTGLLAG